VCPARRSYVWRVVSTHKISGDAAAGFARYLTSGGVSRGDYYAGGPDESQAGQWHASDAALERLGLNRVEPVTRDELVAVMRGVSPADGSAIRAVGGDGSRVAGIDVTFSAPKSVSVLWAVSDPYHRAQIEAAHRGAVGSARERIEREERLVRRREGGVVRWEQARGVVAAEFTHTASRLTAEQESGRGVPDPQLHSHLVVLAAERMDGRFAAVDSRELFRSARVSGAWYRAELASRLQDLGLAVDEQSGAGGRYFEVVGVPVGLSERWSARSEAIAREASRFRVRYGREPRAGELGAITVRTRGSKTLLSGVDVDRAWRAVAEE
jgi:conjugative relaxase-like TrwC/TraI family protein